jgi:hypothetical protein
MAAYGGKTTGTRRQTFGKTNASLLIIPAVSLIPVPVAGQWRSAAALYHAGTKVQLGAHGQLHGLGAHWELWMFVMGGMTNMEALRSATLSGAEYIGMDKDIGSLEAGKLADLVIMDKNPLDDIHNSESISYVMLNGRMYDAATLNETGTHPHKRHKFFWEYDKNPSSYPWHAETHSFMGQGCMGCSTH